MFFGRHSGSSPIISVWRPGEGNSKSNILIDIKYLDKYQKFNSKL